jgi:SNF2 family DNA or RNA helicase
MIQLGSRINLVVCQKSKIQDWVDHFRWNYLWIDDVLDLTDKKMFDLFKGLLNVKTFPPKYMCVGVINYDLLFRRPELKKLQNFTLMLDESSLIQNEKAKRSKFILNMNPENIILLSGTPTSGKYENLWTQLHLLGWTISQDTYNKQYVNWKNIDVGGFIHKIVDKDDPYKNVDRLKSKMREHGAVFMKTEECFDLPEQNFITVNYKSSKEYRKFKKDSIITVDGNELIGDTTLSKMLYLRMLCGQYSQSKLEGFKDLVESTNDRLIVFYNFNEELYHLKKIASDLERPISEVNGQVKDLNAYENEDDSITFVQYQAGAMGLNLQKANKIIYFTLPLMSELFEQSKKRIHRIGQNKACFYYILMCNGSIEEDIFKTLEMRKDYTNELFRE